MKKIAAAVALMLIFRLTAFAAPENISAQSAVLVDLSSGRLLYERNGFAKLPMASTTKIMTAILAIENCEPYELVTVSAAASEAEGSSLWLEIGERLTVKQLLLGLMLKSGNDAAVALAEHTAGSVASFVLLMNAKAKEIGMYNTSFETPNGLDSENHYTTAYDMAVLTRYAMRNSEFREIVGTKEAQIPWMGKEWNRALKNHNKLLWLYDGCTGVKTGYTKKSGRCLVSTAMRDGRELVCVTLNAPDDWNDHEKLLDYGFSAYETSVLAEKGKAWESISVGDEEIRLLCGETFTTSLMIGGTEVAEYRSEIFPVSLPIEQGQTLGRLYIFSEGEFLGGVSLVADRAVAAPKKLKDFIITVAKELI